MFKTLLNSGAKILANHEVSVRFFTNTLWEKEIEV